MAKLIRFAKWMQAGLLLLALPVAAQVKFGETSANANGTISSGYTATYGNLTSFDPRLDVRRRGHLRRLVLQPEFSVLQCFPVSEPIAGQLQFPIHFQCQRRQRHRQLFGGSHFPGSVSYSEAYNSEGNYGVPGLANYVTHGNSDTFGINWNENLPDAPSFSAGFQMGSSNYSVYGTNDTGEQPFHSLNLHSGYSWEGFNLGAYYTNGGGHADIPQIVAGAGRAALQSTTNAARDQRDSPVAVAGLMLGRFQPVSLEQRLPGLQLQRNHRHGQLHRRDPPPPKPVGDRRR